MAKAKSTASKPLTDKQVKEITSFGPAIDDATAKSLERIAGGNEIGTQRRLCLIAVSRDAATLARLRNEAPEAFKEMLEAVNGFVKHIGAVREIAQAAHMRLVIADCMVDSDGKFPATGGAA